MSKVCWWYYAIVPPQQTGLAAPPFFQISFVFQEQQFLYTQLADYTLWIHQIYLYKHQICMYVSISNGTAFLEQDQVDHAKID